jgi:hypothetical protein
MTSFIVFDHALRIAQPSLHLAPPQAILVMAGGAIKLNGPLWPV